MIKRMIRRQYDQLLETCKQTKAEIEYLTQNLADDDFVKRLEIEKTQALIGSIEQDIQAKKQEIHHSEMKNRYEQLTSLYQQTTEEVELLQSELKNNAEEMDQHQADLKQTSHHQAKRERLDLSASQVPQHKSEDYESMLGKWHDSLNKINELEKEQQLIEELAENKEVKRVPPMVLASIPSEEKTDPVSEVIKKEEAPITFSPISEVPKVEMPKEAPVLPVLEVKEETAPETIAKEEAPPALPSQPQIVATPTLQEKIKSAKAEKLVLKEHDQEQVEKVSKGKLVLGVILNVIFYFSLIGAILFLSLLGLYSPTGAPRELLRHSIMRVETEGMGQALPVNTLIVTKRVDPIALQLGDTVTFIRFNETTITHQIYEIYENYQNLGTRGFRLIGAASAEPDNEIHQERNFIGRVILSNYPFGRFMMYVHHHVLLVMIFVVSVLLTLFLLKRKFAPRRQRANKAQKHSKKERGKEKSLQAESATEQSK